MPPKGSVYSAEVAISSKKYRQDVLGLKAMLSKTYSSYKNSTWKSVARDAAKGIFKLLAKKVPVVGSTVAGVASDTPAGYSVTQATTYSQVVATYIAVSETHALKKDLGSARKALGIAVAVNDLMAEALVSAEKDLVALKLKLRQNAGKIHLAHGKISSSTVRVFSATGEDAL